MKKPQRFFNFTFCNYLLNIIIIIIIIITITIIIIIIIIIIITITITIIIHIKHSFWWLGAFKKKINYKKTQFF